MIQENKKNLSKNDSVLNYFLLAGYFIFESLVKALNLIIPDPSNYNKKSSKSLKTNQTREKLFEKDANQLREILKEVDMVSSFEKSKLIEFILLSPEALEIYKRRERESELRKLTVIELKVLLKGVEKISQLNKAELIEMILLIEEKES